MAILEVRKADVSRFVLWDNTIAPRRTGGPTFALTVKKLSGASALLLAIQSSIVRAKLVRSASMDTMRWAAAAVNVQRIQPSN